MSVGQKWVIKANRLVSYIQCDACLALGAGCPHHGQASDLQSVVSFSHGVPSLAGTGFQDGVLAQVIQQEQTHEVEVKAALGSARPPRALGLKLQDGGSGAPHLGGCRQLFRFLLLAGGYGRARAVPIPARRDLKLLDCLVTLL